MKAIFMLSGLLICATLFSQQYIGQIKAYDPDGDLLHFTTIGQRPVDSAFTVTYDGLLFESGINPNGLYEVDVMVDDGYLSDTATMFITIQRMMGDSVVLDSIICYKYQKIMIDSVFVKDSVQVWVDASYWKYDTTRYIYTPECFYTIDTLR